MDGWIHDADEQLTTWQYKQLTSPYQLWADHARRHDLFGWLVTLGAVTQADAQRVARHSVYLACNTAAAESRRSILTTHCERFVELLRDEIEEDLGGLADVGARLRTPEAAWSQRSTPINVAVHGQFSAGKSTLIGLLTAELRHWRAVAAGSLVIDALDQMSDRQNTTVLAEGHADRAFLAALTEWLAATDSVRSLQAVAAAQHATVAAYTARDAIVHDHPSVSRDVVARFTSTWLGFRPTDQIVDAAAAALLYAPLEDFDPDDDDAAVHRLRLDTRHQNRLWKPLTDTQLCYRPIDSLDRPLGANLDDGTPATVADTAGVPDCADELCAQLSGWDPRIRRALNRLQPDERRIALRYAHQETPTSWEQAAVACGQPAEFGERVRRKLRRAGRWLTANLDRGRGARPRAA